MLQQHSGGDRTVSQTRRGKSSCRQPLCWAVRSTASKPLELGPDELVGVGRDAECFTLAHAVQWHCERRVLLNGNVVVFR